MTMAGPALITCSRCRADHLPTLSSTDLPLTMPAAGRAVGCIHKDVAVLWLNPFC